MKISLELPDTFAEKDRQALTELAREALVVRLYALGELTSGEGAELLGLPRRDFLNLLGSYNVSLFDETADLRREASYE